MKTDNAEDVDVVMPMYNLLEYSKNYKKNNGKFMELLQSDNALNFKFKIFCLQSKLYGKWCDTIIYLKMMLKLLYH